MDLRWPSEPSYYFWHTALEGMKNRPEIAATCVWSVANPTLQIFLFNYIHKTLLSKMYKELGSSGPTISQSPRKCVLCATICTKWAYVVMSLVKMIRLNGGERDWSDPLFQFFFPEQPAVFFPHEFRRLLAGKKCPLFLLCSFILPVAYLVRKSEA